MANSGWRWQQIGYCTECLHVHEVVVDHMVGGCRSQDILELAGEVHLHTYVRAVILCVL